MKYRFSFIAFLLFISAISFSQDKIYRKNGKVIEAKIIEVGVDEIKYKEFNNPDGPIYVLDADRINKIVYANGKIEKLTLNIKDPEKYAGQWSKAVKIDFLGPLFGYSQFSFEKSKEIGRSYEFSFGIIGAGKSWSLSYFDTQFNEVKKSQFGLFGGIGYKFGKLPDFILFGKTRYTHRMQGTYVKPIIYFGNYTENKISYKNNNSYSVEKQNVTFGALQLEFGRQWVLGDKFLLDIYEGFGYGFDNKKIGVENSFFTENTTAYNYANLRIGRSPGLSYTFGIKFGMLLK